MAFTQLLAIVEAIFAVHVDEIDCDDCDAEMPHLVELIDAGEDPTLLLPAVQDHLDKCKDCREEFEALLTIVRAENTGLLADTSDG
jgi:hypothetical protein